MIPYQYFLISLVPDPIRNEQVNIGIIGFAQDEVEYRALKDLQRIQVIDPNYDTTQNPMDAFASLIMTLPTEQRMDYLKSLTSDFVRISPVAEGRAENYERFVNAMSQVYDRLVKPISPIVQKRPKITKLKTAIKQTLTRRGLIGEKIDERKVVLDYTIDRAENLVADFAYRNGRLNIVETIDFHVKAQRVRNDKFKEAALLSIKILEAKEIEKNTHGRLIYLPPENDQTGIIAHTHMLGRYYDKIYNYQNPAERGSFFADVERDLVGSLI